MRSKLEGVMNDDQKSWRRLVSSLISFKLVVTQWHFMLLEKCKCYRNDGNVQDVYDYPDILYVLETFNVTLNTFQNSDTQKSCTSEYIC